MQTTIYRCLLLLIVVVGGSPQMDAQKFRYSIPGLDSLEESFIVSGTASTILKNGEAEIISNNSLVSYWMAFHQTDENSPVLDRVRQTLFTSDWYGYYGISPSGRWDIGLHLRYTRARTDNAAASSMFKVFEKEQPFDEEDASSFLDNSLGGLSGIGLRFRMKPFRLNPRLVLSGGYTIKAVTGEEKARRLGADRNQADLGLTYYQELNRNVYYFFGGTFRSFFPSAGVTDESLYDVGASFFLIHRTTNSALTIYPGLTYNLTFRPSQSDAQPNLIKTTETLLAYGGVQYAPNSKYNFFVLGGFPLSVTVPNPQLEFVRSSYSVLALGFRVGI